MEGPKTMAEGQYGVRFRETQIQNLVSGTVVYENLYMGEGGNTRAESQKTQRYSFIVKGMFVELQVKGREHCQLSRNLPHTSFQL